MRWHTRKWMPGSALHLNAPVDTLPLRILWIHGTMDTVDTLQLWKLWIHCHWGGKDQGQWWHVFVAHYLTFLAFCSWRKKTECWHLSLFKKRKRITMLESLIFWITMLTSGADIVGWGKKWNHWHLRPFLGGNRFKLGDTIGDWLSILTRSPNFLCLILWLFFSKTDNQLWIMESGCLLIMP